MKKFYTLLTSLILFASLASKAQDTLLYESFNFQNFYDNYFMVDAIPPPGNVTDTMWYSYDADGFADGSGSNRDGGWFPTGAFADIDTTDNVVISSSSWFSTVEVASNWLISSNVQLGEHDTLFWKSAPFQTPRYLDGYEVRLSTTTNDDLAFTNLLFTAAEMTVTSSIAGDSSDFANHTFSSTLDFIHGLDSTYVEYDSARPDKAMTGQLRPFSVALDAFANKNVFIAIHHNSEDDNLISIDDIMIRGTAGNPLASIKENVLDMNLNVFPNPATESAQLNFKLSSETPVTISVNNIAGKLIYSENKGSMVQGRHFANINTAALAKGFYTVTVQTKNGKNTTKLIVQ
ncbi:MAG: T9SS type A sorting domain-containing protein [Bacteroidota bacterium]